MREEASHPRGARGEHNLSGRSLVLHSIDTERSAQQAAWAHTCCLYTACMLQTSSKSAPQAPLARGPDRGVITAPCMPPANTSTRWIQMRKQVASAMHGGTSSLPVTMAAWVKSARNARSACLGSYPVLLASPASYACGVVCR
jgi:hypothetical protein